MRWATIPWLLLGLAAAGCTSSATSVLDSAVERPRFADSDPQDFNGRTPHRHEVHGIDVSKWNGAVEWHSVRKSGVDFAFIKATEGGDRLDSGFHAYWQGARAAGIAHAPYHFFYFCTPADVQADWFIANVPKEAVHLPPVLDAEWNPTSKTCRLRPEPPAVRAELQRFLQRLHAHYGKRPIIYTTVDFHRENLEGHFPDHPFWVRAVAQHPSEIYPGRNWTFWQYTSTGTVPGVDGDTDINVFAGNRGAWRNWMASVSK
ncbi:glycoside hydrolase family 25 protein [Peteryoungia ipomoeae]|uniref:Glycoside hydrolase n=1 Tax=Peteryoungia ipomoeae TaxID=1210932 RepID=A0A4S8P4A5_9HYPH|nr:GH25 family lysozyme [Peteryoungia ipomoeae]THV24818.1 glycoside hydrolase [Peteryoungia ipomoeae]